jgi:hypothetical protein
MSSWYALIIAYHILGLLCPLYCSDIPQEKQSFEELSAMGAPFSGPTSNGHGKGISQVETMCKSPMIAIKCPEGRGLVSIYDISLYSHCSIFEPLISHKMPFWLNSRTTLALRLLVVGIPNSQVIR